MILTKKFTRKKEKTQPEYSFQDEVQELISQTHIDMQEHDVRNNIELEEGNVFADVYVDVQRYHASYPEVAIDPIVTVAVNALYIGEEEITKEACPLAYAEIEQGLIPRVIY